MRSHSSGIAKMCVTLCFLTVFRSVLGLKSFKSTNVREKNANQMYTAVSPKM